MGQSRGMNPLYVEKKNVLVHLQLSNGAEVKGFVHLAHRIRLTDTLNLQASDKPFLPLTDAQLITPDGEQKAVAFIVINRQNIITCISQQGFSE